MTSSTHVAVQRIENAYLQPSKGNWGVIALFCVMGLAPLLFLSMGVLPITPSGQFLIGLYATIFLVPCAVFGYWQTRAVVVADDTGLRWRGLGKWQTANWSEITDYYEKLRPTPKPAITIVMKSIKLSINPGLWEKPSALKEVIARKALNAQVRKWDFFGARPEIDWPRTFHYNTNDNRLVVYAMPALAAMGFALCAWNIAGGVYRTQTSLGFSWAVASTGISLFGILPLMLMSGLLLRASNTTARRRDQFITLDTGGLVFGSDNRRIEARWEEITDLVIGRRGIVPAHSVITTHGTFGFLASISDFQILCLALATHATSLPEAKWHSAESDVLGGAASLWSSRREGVGKRVYHYRTRTNRSLLSLALFFASVPIIGLSRNSIVRLGEAI